MTYDLKLVRKLTKELQKQKSRNITAKDVKEFAEQKCTDDPKLKEYFGDYDNLYDAIMDELKLPYEDD